MIDVGVAEATRELMPPIDDAFWVAARERRLVIPRCLDCQQYRFPPRLGCPNCGATRTEWVASAGHGSIYSFVVVHQRLHPAFDSYLPYAVALVQLDEGPRMLAMLIESNPSEARVDARVEVAFQALDDEIVIPRMRIVPA
jgi:uncharacterized protein